MEFLPLSRRRCSARNGSSGEERGETEAFADYAKAPKHSLLNAVEGQKVISDHILLDQGRSIRGWKSGLLRLKISN